MLTVSLLSSIRAGPLLNHVLRSSIVVRGTCDRNMSVYDAVLRTLLAYATQEKPQPMPDSVLALVELILAVCRCFSRVLLIGSDST